MNLQTLLNLNLNHWNLIKTMPKSNQEKLLAALNALYEITPILDEPLDSKASEHHRAKLVELCVHIANLYE